MLNANDGSRCMVGCVATAMAQVIAYNRWPEHQMAAFPAYTSKKAYKKDTLVIEMPAIENTQVKYDYDNMLPTYREGFYTQKQADAVALLSYHCGRAVQMLYGEVSTSDVFCNNLSDYFGYDKNDLSHLYRRAYTQEQWQTIIDRELTAKRVVLVGGSSNGGGHEFVLDGADGTGLYHINWGWSGANNGYFDLSILNPKKGGSGSGNGTDGYLRYMDIIVGIQKPGTAVIDPVVEPLNASKLMGETNAIVWTKTKRTGANDTFKGEAKIGYYISNYHHAFKGYVGLRVTAPSGEQDVIQLEELYTLETFEDAATASFTLDGTWPSGRYEFEPVYSFDGKTWYACLDKIGTKSFVMTDTEIISEDYMPSPYTATLTADTDLYNYASNAFTLTVTNTTAVEKKGTFKVYMSRNADNSDVGEKLTDVHLFLQAGGTVEQSIAAYTKIAGDCYISITDPEGYYILDRQKFTVLDNGYQDDIELESVTTSASTDLETSNAYYQGVRVQAPVAYGGSVTFTARVTNTAKDTYKGTLKFGINDCQGNAFTFLGTTKVTMLLKGGETKDYSITYTPDAYTDIHSILCTVTGAVKPTTSWTLPAVSAYDADVTLSDNQRMVYISRQTTGQATGIECPGTTETSAPKTIYTINGVRLERITDPGVYIIDGQKQAVK